MANDPRALIDHTTMTSRQWIAVILMIALNALDGFDVLSIAFAAPGIAKEWGIGRDALGVVLAMELVGMGFGSILLGGAADRFGRRVTVLGCLTVMSIGMYMATTSGNLTELGVWRFITGLGIGGMLAATNAVTAESTSKAGRSLSMAIYVIGYPLGGVIGGFAAQLWLLPSYDWRAVFLFGAVVTAAMIPLVMLLVPETAAFHAAVRRDDAVARINRTLAVFGKAPIGGLPERAAEAPRPKLSDILVDPKLRPVTLLLAFGYMFHTLTFYYILKFAPTIVAGAGFSQPDAASSLTYANIGGALGGLLFGFVMKRFDIKGPTIGAALLGVVAVAYFGLGHDSLWAWRIAAFFTMFFLNAAIVGYYAAFARGFPAYARATGTGFVLGVGRVGAAGSPIIAGYLFSALGNDQLTVVSVIMCAGTIIGAVLLYMLPIVDADHQVIEPAAYD